jgi:Ice-binding-like
MKTRLLASSSRYLLAIPLAALLTAACSDSDTLTGTGGASGTGGGMSVAGAPHGNAGNAGNAGALEVGGAGNSGGQSDAGATSGAGATNEAGANGMYEGPSVGSAKTFAALAYSAITTANVSTVIGEIGVSAGAMSTITGFDAPDDIKYGTDSLAPNSQRTILAQQHVTALVSDIDPRACDADYTNVVGGLTGDITLYPGVTCMNSFSADVLLNGHLTLDARGDSNAFFIIRGNLTLTVADAAQVVLANGAEACGVFWRFSKAVTIGKTVKFYGTVIAGTAITMNTGSTLVGRALAQTAGVMLDANSITVPTDGLIGSAGVCTHVQ